MRALDITHKDLLTIDTLRGLREETVEIWEHEMVQTMGMSKRVIDAKAASPRSPKLVIDDGFGQSRVFVSRARRDSKIDQVLREIIGAKRKG